jgi:intracellular multiplication protein IcmT
MAMDDSTHWRDAARRPRFYLMDALAALPLILFLLHISLTTFCIALLAIAFFIVLERFQFTVPVFFRWFRATLAGSIRLSKPWWRR